jgi:hypothetical protein
MIGIDGKSLPSTPVGAMEERQAAKHTEMIVESLFDEKHTNL